MKEALSFSEFFSICRSKWKWFVYSVITVMLLAIAYLIVAQPKYTRKAQVLIKDDGGMGGLMSQLGGLGDIGSMFGLGSSNVYNELYAMQSPFLMLNVVKQMHLDVSYTIKGIRNKDLYAETLPIIVDFKDITDEDDVKMKIDLNKNGNIRVYKLKKNDDKYDDDLTGRVNTTLKTSVGKIHIASTPYLKTMEDDEVTITVKRTEPMAVVDHLAKKSLTLAVSSRDASIIEITCVDVSKKRATDLINTIIREYQRENNEDKDAQIAVSERYVLERLASLEDELKVLDNKVADYKSKTMMPDLEVMSKVYAESAKDISAAQMEIGNQLYVALSIRDYLRDESKKDELLPALLITGNDALQEQVAQYNTLQLQRNKIIASSSKENPLVKDLDSQLSVMHNAILTSANNAIKQLQLQLRGVNAKASEGKQLLSSAPKKAIGGMTDERAWKVLNEVYIFLLQKREEAQMSRSLRTDVRILTPPLGVKEQSSPVKRNVLFGAFMLGLFIPACFIFLRERYAKK
ncbi:MAG: hypothetical protein J6Y46_02510 [Prevotella sp.]|nr:hypothetical protein [Prevotella sp.]